MVRCAGCFLHQSKRVVDIIVNLCGIGMIIYCLWLLKKWNDGFSQMLIVTPLPRPWQISFSPCPPPTLVLVVQLLPFLCLGFFPENLFQFLFFIFRISEFFPLLKGGLLSFFLFIYLFTSFFSWSSGSVPKITFCS